MEYYSIVKKKKIRKFSGKWINLENIILGEVTQTQREKHVFSLICVDNVT